MPKCLYVLVLATTCLAGKPSYAQEPLLDELPPIDPCEAVEGESLFKPIGEIRLHLPDDGKRLPPDCSQLFSEARDGNYRRFDTNFCFHWEPTNFLRRPVYFDDVPLERYGQSKSELLQPGISASRFVLSTPMLPYRMALDPPWRCVSNLGHRPPGDCVPCIKQVPPIQGNATFVEAAVAVGLVFLLP